MANSSGNWSDDTYIVVGLTTVELWIHMTLFYVLLCGCLSTVGNVLICMAIVQTKDLRRRFFVIIFSLSVCRGMLSVQYLIMGIYRILRTLEISPAKIDRLSCHAIHFWLFTGLTLELALLLLLVLERAMALITVDAYRLMSTDQAVKICALVFLITILIKLPPSYADVDMNELIVCVNSYSPTGDGFNLYTQNIDLALLAVILLAYVSLMVYIRLRVWKTMKAADSSSAAAQTLKRQFHLLAIMRNLVLAHCTLSLIPKVLRSLVGLYEDRPEISARLTAYGGLFTTIDLFANVVILLFSNVELRSSAFGCKEKTCEVCPTRTGVA